MILRVTDSDSKEDLLCSLLSRQVISNDSKAQVVSAVSFLQSIIRSVDSRVTLIGTTVNTHENRIKIILHRANSTLPTPIPPPICMNRLRDCLMNIFYFEDGRSRGIHVSRVDLYAGQLAKYNIGFVTLKEFNEALRSLQDKIYVYRLENVVYYTGEHVSLTT